MTEPAVDPATSDDMTVLLSGLADAIARARTLVACQGGSTGCTGTVLPHLADDARSGDLHRFPYCPPCRIAAAADAALDDPAHGPALPTHRRGMRFRHARYRQQLPGIRAADSPHVVCTVTRVTARAVHYRLADDLNGRGHQVIDRGRFHTVSVGAYLPARATAGQEAGR